MKQTTWCIENGDGTSHTVTYALSRFTGRTTVTVNGDAFTLSAGFLSMKAARREPFRLVGLDGDAEQAILVVDKRGRPTLLFRGEEVEIRNSEFGIN